MKVIFTKETKLELVEVEQLFKKSLNPWWDEISEYFIELDQEAIWNYVPSISLLAYKALGLERDLSISMTNMFKTVLFANMIHELISDEEEGQVHNQRLQFTILIGDYIFGRVLKLLLEAGAEELLPSIANMMVEINEGMILKYKYPHRQREALEKTKGSMYGYIFYSAANLAKLNEEKCQAYMKFGASLGIALELFKKGNFEELSGQFGIIESNLKYFIKLQKANHNIWENKIDELRTLFFNEKKVAIV